MEVKRDLNFEVNTSVDLTKMLTGAIMDVRRGMLDHETVRSITLLADKLNKNLTNKIEYKKISKHKDPIEFFEDEHNNKKTIPSMNPLTDKSEIK